MRTALALLACLAIAGCANSEPSEEPASDLDEAAYIAGERQGERDCAQYSRKQLARILGMPKADAHLLALEASKHAYPGELTDEQAGWADGCVDGLTKTR